MYQAMILAAGRGARLRPLTDNLPKPLVKLHGKPLIAYQIEALVRASVSRIIINTHYLGEMIEKYCGYGNQFGVEILYTREDPILDTGGGIINALPLLDEKPLIVTSGDVLTHFPYETLFSKIKPFDKAHLVFVENPDFKQQGDYGVKESRVVATEKTYTYSSIGIYTKDFFSCTSKTIVPLVELIQFWVDKNLVSGEIYHGPWHNIGSEKELKSAEAMW